MQLTSEDLERCRPRVVAFLSRFIRDPNEVQDVTQEALLKAWQTAHKCRNNNPCAWAVGVAQFVLFRYYRSEQCYRRNSRDDWHETFHDPGIRDAPSLAVVLEILQPFTAEARLFFFLHFLCGWTYQQIAAEMGLTERTVAYRVQRVRKKLAETHRGGILTGTGGD